MKKALVSFILLFIASTSVTAQKTEPDQKELLKDYMTWYTYTYHNIKLAQDFIGLDTASRPIKKEPFLQALSTGNYYAVRISEGQLATYQLYRFPKADKDIQSTAKQLAEIELQNYHRIGETFPDFEFTDINGQVYNTANTKNKIIVLKCWFIHCVACVREFPELNKLVNSYRKNKDVVFISLAYDSKEALTNFIKTNPFKYPVVPVKEEFMEQGYLKITAYPTHIIIDRTRHVAAFVNEASDLIPLLKLETDK